MMRKSARAYTLVEMMVVLLIFVFIFGAVITIMLASDRNWRTGNNIIAEQQEARKAMDLMVRLLRQSNPQWGITIETDKILFYKPVFDAAGQLINTSWVIFKRDPLDPAHVIKSEQGLPTVVLAQDVEGIKFSAGCPGCATFDCAAISSDCPAVAIEIKTKKNEVFTLTSKVLLRNAGASLPEDTQITEPPEGEF